MAERDMSLRTSEERFTAMSNSDGAWVGIDDDDFHWDAALRVTGDFENEDEKLRYIRAVCAVLNRHQDEIPSRPDAAMAREGG